MTLSFDKFLHFRIGVINKLLEWKMLINIDKWRFTETTLQVTVKQNRNQKVNKLYILDIA